jgi:hypothetical protein
MGERIADDHHPSTVGIGSQNSQPSQGTGAISQAHKDAVTAQENIPTDRCRQEARMQPMSLHQGDRKEAVAAMGVQS